MSKFKVILYFPDGTEQESEDVFDTEEEAQEYADYECSSYSAGAEVLNLSNPGDYPLDGEELTYEIIEVDD